MQFSYLSYQLLNMSITDIKFKCEKRLMWLQIYEPGDLNINCILTTIHFITILHYPNLSGNYNVSPHKLCLTIFKIFGYPLCVG